MMTLWWPFFERAASGSRVAEWIARRTHDRGRSTVIGSNLTLVALCTRGKRAWLLFPHSTQVYLKWVPGYRQCKTMLIAEYGLEYIRMLPRKLRWLLNVQVCRGNNDVKRLEHLTNKRCISTHYYFFVWFSEFLQSFLAKLHVWC